MSKLNKSRNDLEIGLISIKYTKPKSKEIILSRPLVLTAAILLGFALIFYSIRIDYLYGLVTGALIVTFVIINSSKAFKIIRKKPKKTTKFSTADKKQFFASTFITGIVVACIGILFYEQFSILVGLMVTIIAFLYLKVDSISEFDINVREDRYRNTQISKGYKNHNVIRIPSMKRVLYLGILISIGTIITYFGFRLANSLLFFIGIILITYDFALLSKSRIKVYGRRYGHKSNNTSKLN